MFERLFRLDGEKKPPNPTAAHSDYEQQLRAVPSYELKAEYIAQFGNNWDSLPRPKIESAIKALLERRAAV